MFKIKTDPTIRKEPKSVRITMMAKGINTSHAINKIGPSNSLIT